MVLSITNLSGFGGGGGPFTMTYMSSVVPDVVSPTATYTGVSIGDAASDRIVFAALTHDNLTSGITYTCTIAGLTATEVLSVEFSGADYVSFFAATVPTGTTATIVFTSSDSMTTNSGMHVWVARGLQSITPYSSGSDTGPSPGLASVTVNIGTTYNATIAASINGSATTVTWTNATEGSDFNTGSANHSSATATSSPVGTLAVGVTPVAVVCKVLVLSYSQ